MKNRSYIGVLGLLLLVSFACESTESEPEGLDFGKFEGLVGTSQNTGLYEELEGQAWFSLNESDSVFSFELYSGLISDTSETKLIWSIKSSDLPQEGTYSFVDVDTTQKVVSSGFTGLYLSPTVGLNEKYYPESGSLTITSIESENGIKGAFEGVIFKVSEVDSAVFVRQYSKVTGEFYAASESLR